MISLPASCYFYFEMYVVLCYLCSVFARLFAAVVCAELRKRVLSWPIWLSDLRSFSEKLSLGIFGRNN